MYPYNFMEMVEQDFLIIMVYCVLQPMAGLIRRFVTFYIGTLEIFLLTYLLTYLLT